MKTLISVKFFSFLLILVSALTPAQSHSKGSKYTLITEVIDSKILSEQRTVSVQLPKNYHNAPDNRYPVIYRLDGAENILTINAVLEKLQSQDAAPEVIIVAIENTDRLRDMFPTANQSPYGPIGVGGGSAKFLDFISKELMPMVERKYRTHEYRIIEGASAAGVFSLFALINAPDLFDAALTYSAAVWWADGAEANSTVQFLKDKKRFDKYIYTAIGNEPAPMRPYYDRMIAGIREHQPTGLRWVNDAFAEVPHNLVTSAGSFNAYFNLFYSAAMPIRFYNGNLNSIENYYKKVSEQRGKKMSAPESVIRQLGYFYVSQQNFAEANKLFKYGIERYPNVPDAYNGLAYGYEQSGQYNEALEQVNKALAIATEDDDGYQVYVNRRERLLKQVSH